MLREKILELEDTLRRFNKRKIIVIIRKIKNLIIEFKKTTNNIIGKIKKLIRKIIEYFKKYVIVFLKIDLSPY